MGEPRNKSSNNTHPRRRFPRWGSWSFTTQDVNNNESGSPLNFVRWLLRAVVQSFGTVPQQGAGQFSDLDYSAKDSFVTARSFLSQGEDDIEIPSPVHVQRRSSLVVSLIKLVTRPRSFFKRSLTSESSESHHPSAASWRFGSDGQVIDADDFSPFGHDWPTTRMSFSLDNGIIGMGKSGTVKRAKHRESGSVVAIKVLDRSKMYIDPLAVEDEWTQLEREVSVHSKLSAHPNVISIKGAFHDSNFAYMVLELAKGDLFSEIGKAEQNGRGMSERRVKRIAFDIACALRSCHEAGFIHRDVKAENVLLVGKGDDEVAKLGDFGVCAPMDDDGFYVGRRVGTLGYLGPEGMNRESRVGPKIDWWAFGVLLFVMFNGELPYPMYDDASNFQEPIKFPSPFQRRRRVSWKAKHLVRGLLEPDAAKRFGAEQVFSHPWFRKIAGRG